MKKYICLKDDTEFFDITGKELICPVCGGKEVAYKGEVNQQVHPVMRDFVNMAVKPLRMHNYYPASERDGL